MCPWQGPLALAGRLCEKEPCLRVLPTKCDLGLEQAKENSLWMDSRGVGSVGTAQGLAAKMEELYS